MEYKKIGRTELNVSRIGFGCWAIGGHGYGVVDEAESIRAIQKALDLGVNWFDTADVYGFGQSEVVLSKALEGRRHDVVIATKFGVRWDDSGRTFRDCSAKAVMEALEGSLRRLKVDCIPLYQIHWHDGKTPLAETMEALRKCQEAGKVRYVGCSNFSLDLIRESRKNGRLESIQLPYSIGQRAAEEMLRTCHDHLGMGTLVYGILIRGLLTGKYGTDARFEDGDTRSRDGQFKGPLLARHLALSDALRYLSMRCGLSPVQGAIRWVLDQPHVTSAIVGAKTAAQIEENVGAVDRILCNDECLEDLLRLTEEGES
jgi:aryl-alcohol dehydrogenase-like predicted oxidoreductase